MTLTPNFKLATPGQTATKFFAHPLDPNMGAAIDGSIWTRYVARRHGGVVGEWRELTNYISRDRYLKSDSNQAKGQARTTKRSKEMISLPTAFEPASHRHGAYMAGRFTLECYLKRVLESWEVCRHGVNGPNDHSFSNVSPGDPVNNMIDDLENGTAETNLTYLIQAKNRIDRLISNRLNSTK